LISERAEADVGQRRDQQYAANSVNPAIATLRHDTRCS
jgi:hypothetical protein